MRMCNLALALLAFAPVPAGRTEEGGWHADPDTFICTWLIGEPIDNDDANSGFSRDWVGEADVRPQPGRDWRLFDDRLFIRSYDSYNDLYSYFTVKRDLPVAGRAVYLHTYLHVPTDVPQARLGLGYHSACKVVLNGETICNDPNEVLRRDGSTVAAPLRAGWNRLLVKVANRGDGPLGFYLSVTDAERRPVPGLTVSAAGGEGPLAVVTGGMEDIGTPPLPNAYREWPYVGADSTPFLKSAEITNWKMQVDGWYESYLVKAPSLRLQARGGSPGYAWQVAEGSLPPGLALEANGRIGGTVRADCPLRTFGFTVRVTDADGNSARKDLAITVRERPNRWVEECGLIGLIHSPEKLDAAQIEDLAGLMKRQGYGLAIPIGYGNGAADDIPRWKSEFRADNPRERVLSLYRQAVQDRGMQFGVYLGELELPSNRGRAGCLTLCREAYRENRPAVIWLDNAGRNFPLIDAVFSMWRAHDEDLVIIKNGIPTKGAFDWDMICWEGWGAWGDRLYDTWPRPLPWFKKHRPETWRFIPDPQVPAIWGPAWGNPTWQDYVPVFLSIIAEGFVADLDHSLKWVEGDDLSDQYRVHQGIAEWANPPGKPSLVPAYVNVTPGPLRRDARWGYNVIDATRTAIYLYILKNDVGCDGILGRPGDPAARTGLLLTGCKVPVRAVTLMNTDSPLEFEQDGRQISVDIRPEQLNPVATIVRIDLAEPHPEGIGEDALNRDAEGRVNLAYRKPAKLLGLDCVTELGPSGLSYAEGGVDGRHGTLAQASMQWPWVFHVDLQEPERVGRIRIAFGTDCYATEYAVKLSEDGETWREVAHTRDAAGEDAVIDVTGKARYVRIFGLKPDGENQPGRQMAIRELTVYPPEP